LRIGGRLAGKKRRFDVFLSYNSRDRLAARRIWEELRSRGPRPWLDVEDLTPGRLWQEEAEEVIRTVRSGAVLVGQDGIGPWVDVEMRPLLTQLVQRRVPVIPVLLPGAPAKPDLPLFLGELNWVDLRGGITPEGLDRLERGIRARRPNPSKTARSDGGSSGPKLHNLPFESLGRLFMGRDLELAQIGETLAAEPVSGGVPRTILQGLGGIGKTRCLRFCHFCGAGR
jgi:hypothetical protein